MEIHVGEVGIGRRVEGPALLVMTPQTIGFRECCEEMATEAQAFCTRAHAEQAKGPLAAMDLPATAIRVEKQMEKSSRAEEPRQSLEACLRFPEVMEHTHRIDVVEGTFALKIEQAALHHPDLGTLVATGTAQTLPGHGQRAGTDIDRQDLTAWIEVGQVIGAHPGATAGIENPPGGFCHGQGAGDRAEGAVQAPSPVVSGGCPVLERIRWIGETVVKGAHDGGGGIPWTVIHPLDQGVDLGTTVARGTGVGEGRRIGGRDQGRA